MSFPCPVASYHGWTTLTTDAVAIYVGLSKLFPAKHALIDKANHNPLAADIAPLYHAESGEEDKSLEEGEKVQPNPTGL